MQQEEQKSKEQEETTFHPTILARSRQMVAAKLAGAGGVLSPRDVHTQLYNDAEARTSRHRHKVGGGGGGGREGGREGGMLCVHGIVSVLGMQERCSKHAHSIEKVCCAC